MTLKLFGPQQHSKDVRVSHPHNPVGNETPHANRKKPNQLGLQKQCRSCCQCDSMGFVPQTTIQLGKMCRFGWQEWASVGVNSCANSDLVATHEETEKKRFSENCPNSDAQPPALKPTGFSCFSLKENAWVPGSFGRSSIGVTTQSYMSHAHCFFLMSKGNTRIPGLCLPCWDGKKKDKE